MQGLGREREAAVGCGQVARPIEPLARPARADFLRIQLITTVGQDERQDAGCGHIAELNLRLPIGPIRPSVVDDTAGQGRLCHSPLDVTDRPKGALPPHEGGELDRLAQLLEAVRRAQQAHQPAGPPIAQVNGEGRFGLVRPQVAGKGDLTALLAQ